MDISHELKMMLITNTEVHTHIEKMDFNFEGKTYRIPAMKWFEIKLDLQKYPKLFSECEHWYDIRMPLKIDLAQFKGLWPVQCNRNTMVVNFLADSITRKNQTWKDWFEKGVAHASE